MKYYVKIGLIMPVYLDPNLTSGGHDAVGGMCPTSNMKNHCPDFGGYLFGLLTK
jgi:hypothetical protein